VFNNLNPSWSRVIFLEGYKFGVPFYFEVGVFDFDASQTGKTEQELSRMDAQSQAVITSNAASRALMRDGNFPHKVMGTALFEVGQVLGARGNVGSKSLQTGGAIYVNIEKCSSGADNGKVLLQLRGIKLKNCQTLGRTSSPFYELYRKIERPTGATWISVYRSNALRGDLNPLWTGTTLDLEATCNGDLGRAMKLIVWDHRKTGKHKHMGEFETTMKGFIESTFEHQGVQDIGFTLVKNDKEVGTIQVLEATLTETPKQNGAEKPKETKVAEKKRASGAPASPSRSPSKPKVTLNSRRNDRPEFVDYLSGGCQISLAVAIDFTASNGDPRQPGTPHYFHPPESKEWNDYEKAIFAVGSILAKYDSDQRFPVWGFGAKYNNVVRHCFQCGTEVEVEGVQGIMDAYRGVFRTPLTMSYPTKLTEVIQTAAAYARHEQVRCTVVCFSLHVKNFQVHRFAF
jgi:Copine/C2 domain